MRDLILTAIILVCSVTALRRPSFGVLTFIWLGFFNPQSMTWGSTPHSLIIALSTMVGYLFSTEPKKFLLQREAILLLLLWILFGITTAFAIYPDRALKELIFISKILLMVFLSMSLIDTDGRLQSLIRVIALSLGFYALKGVLFVLVSGGEQLVFGPQGSFLEANNMIGLALGMNLPLLVYLIKNEERPWLRWICRAMFIASYPSIVFTYSRGAWLGLAAVTALMLLRSRYKFRIAAASVGFSIFLLPIAITVIPERLANRYEALENYDTESSAQMRFGSWAYCRRLAFAYPMTGGGFNHYSVENYDKFAPDYLDQWGGESRWKRTSCHSIWFTVLGEHGFIGFLLWLGLGGCVFQSLWRIRSQTKAIPENSSVYDLAGALQASVIGYVIVGTFIDAAYFDMIYYLIAIVLIMKKLLQRSQAAEALVGARKIEKRPVLIPVNSSLSR